MTAVTRIDRLRTLWLRLKRKSARGPNTAFWSTLHARVEAEFWWERVRAGLPATNDNGLSERRLWEHSAYSLTDEGWSTLAQHAADAAEATGCRALTAFCWEASGGGQRWAGDAVQARLRAAYKLLIDLYDGRTDPGFAGRTAGPCVEEMRAVAWVWREAAPPGSGGVAAG